MSLTPFIRHELEHQPGTAAAPENSCTRCSPPLGREPDILLPGDPAAPGTQVPPHIETPGQTPHPDTGSTPQGVPMTDGTPVACRQKNAKDFLAGDVPLWPILYLMCLVSFGYFACFILSSI